MELTIEQALQKGLTAHQGGDLQEAERVYRAILQTQPAHPDANHNLGIIAVSVNQAEAALPLFKTALEANPKIEQFWLSYLDALIKVQQFEQAKQALLDANKAGVVTETLDRIGEQLMPSGDGKTPSQAQLSSLSECYKSGQYDIAEQFALLLTQEFPSHQFGWKILGALYGQTGRNSEAVNANQTAVELSPQDAEAHNNLGINLKELGRLDEAEASYRQAIELRADFSEAHYNLGNTLKELGRLGDAEASLKQSITLKSDYAEAHNNLGITLKELGQLDEAEASLKQSITLKPDYAEAYNNLGITLQELGRLEEAGASHMQAIALKSSEADAYWNLSGLEKTVQGSEYWIDQCLIADVNFEKAKLTKVALRFYQGDRSHFDKLTDSKLKQNPYMRSFDWAFNLPNLPELHFNKWYFFDAIISQSVRTRPFYEFGVWRGTAFRYLIQTFKKGYGFDTFTGLPEDWNVGQGIEKADSYSAGGNLPNIEGGEFIVGKFEDTLPSFYSESRPMASVINFDADLYSSTICALTYSKPVIDRHTILIFDEFIVNDSWEQDEFRALNEFCSTNHYIYEVIAISFFTKQVAVKLMGI